MQGRPDFVVDAIDNIDSKVRVWFDDLSSLPLWVVSVLSCWEAEAARLLTHPSFRLLFLLPLSPSSLFPLPPQPPLQVDLLVYCHQHSIPVFSSLGAGAKSDPSRVQVR